MVNVIGLGYIGLPTAVMLASCGICVVGTDCNSALVKKLRDGKPNFIENGFETLFRSAVKFGIRFSSDYQPADIYIIAVPTPYCEITKKINPDYVCSSVGEVIKVCPEDAVIVIESTVSPGTIDRYVRPIIDENKLKTGKSVNLVHAPERIIPGNMIEELIHNSRVIGADNPEIGMRIKKLYSSFCTGEIVVTDIRTAEMTKVAENTFRAVNIAFANELAKICRLDGTDVYEVIKICNMHPRVNILQPGPGVGGHCISIDPWFFVGDYPDISRVIETAMTTNSGMPDYVLGRIYEIMKENGIDDFSRVGLYGLTYKENVDDCRESPTLQLLESQKRHFSVPIKVYDPLVTYDITANQYHNFDSFIFDTDFVVIMVGHREICDNMDKLKNKIILDTRNVCNLPGAYKL